MNNDELKEMLARAISKEIDMLSKDNINGMEKTQCDTVSLAQAVIEALRPMMQEVLDVLGKLLAQSGMIYSGEAKTEAIDKAKQALASLECWKGNV